MIEMIEMMKTALVILKSDKRGVTAVEYAVIAAVLVGVISTAFTSLGGRLTTTMAGVLP